MVVRSGWASAGRYLRRALGKVFCQMALVTVRPMAPAINEVSVVGKRLDSWSHTSYVAKES